ncbi:glucose-6-phosphate 1-dehydrogenase [Catalinimonas alkaloidigena]|uniref:glucose-6-phosphate dehydrogenase n=1 Tax=Catalinimonas alkaloidigena TaxID=1075417 RepID=UPI0024075483|nr:glucose-6-phosphate dehydrogenase [Catalinimonas alkaloidigena]MDF9797635.1 glucose-6-phosphate 1-dehydrogenase [Catalinimonas alkaloidigena]
MEFSKAKLAPTVLIIFGGSGDLNKRKLIPALFNLFLDSYLPDQFSVIGLGRTEYSNEEYREMLRKEVAEFSRREIADQAVWNIFAEHIEYFIMDVKKKESFQQLDTKIAELEQSWNVKANRLFYLSVAPQLFATIATNLASTQACHDLECSRIVIEKPFGHDLKSARQLNKLLTDLYDEKQIFRIDHYLGKETVQNILTFRFANTIFEPLWNRNYIDHVQITVAETVGVESRGSYYEESGALRDMVQNHVLQLVSMIAMEPPINLDADEIRNKKVDVLKAIRILEPEEVDKHAVRAQYDKGWIRGKKVKGYTEEEGVSQDSTTETYTALKFYIDNWRWQDVPIYVRTGKRMADKCSVITIQLRKPPHRAFAYDHQAVREPNRIIINIQPDMGITIRFQAKRPGIHQILNPVEMVFDYQTFYDAEPPEAYEALLLDAIEGNAALFMRADQVEEAWKVVMPILDKWKENGKQALPKYASGSWGPQEADDLLKREEHEWINPKATNVKETVIEENEQFPKKGILNLHVYENTDDLSYSAAELFVRKSCEAVEKYGRFVVCLTGGSSPKALYSLLSKVPFVNQVPWNKTYVFWGDERPVPIHDKDSNAGMAHKALLDHVPVPKEHIFPIHGEFRADIAALQYEETLQEFFQGRSPRFDLILLGMGDDGHTASLFPHVAFSHKSMTWVKELWVEKLDTYRISLMPQLINQAECVAFLAFGEKKADALHEVLEGVYNPEEYPAQLIKPEDGELHWYIDHLAASKLNKSIS